MSKATRKDASSPRDIFSSGNYRAAFPVCLRAAQKGDLDSALLVGWMYVTGNGVERGVDEAIAWFQTVANQGEPLGAYYLGRAYELSGDIENAARSYERSEVSEFAPACYRLAELYVAGRGVTRNVGKAYELYERAMAGGHLFGRAKLASFLIRGYKGFSGRIRGLLMVPAILISALRERGSEELLL